MPDLPISACREKLVKLVEDNPVIVVSGETGCGKTTKIPQYLFDAPSIRSLVARWRRREDATSHQHDEPRVVIVQPHRIAAIAMARRVASERDCELGLEVGYSVRWDSMVDAKLTKIRYVTDGTLVKEYVGGRRLGDVDIVVIDEAHERSLNIDVLLALIKKQLNTTYANRRAYPRPRDIPIRFIVTSATLDVEKFCHFFNDCPLLTIPGKLYPVAVKHVPVKVATGEAGDEEAIPDENVGGIIVNETDAQGVPGVYNPGIRRRKKLQQDQVWLSPDAAVTAAVTISLRIHVETPVSTGHILNFLAGAAECERAVKLMHIKLQQMVDEQEAQTGNASTIPSAVVIPLYGSLDAHQQANVFVQVEPDCRKIVFATNVAETSLTVAGVGHIVDSGIVKQTNFHPRSGMVALNVSGILNLPESNSLSIQRVPVSKTQARQRAGRAGRTKDGTCWRLYGEETFNQLDEHTTPEILRTDPSAAVLNLLAMNIRDILSLQFIDQPNQLSIALALKELATLGAIHPDTLHVTPVGRAMSQTPLDPVYARCFVASLEYDVVEEIATILGLLSAEQIFTSPNLAAMVEDPDSGPLPTLFEVFRIKHKRFRDPNSDHMTLLNIYSEWQKRRGSEVKLMRKDELYDWCWDNYLSMRALLTTEKIKKQLVDIMPEIEQLVGEPGKEFVSRLRTMKKKERVLRALCQGLFVNTAKLHLAKSAVRGEVAKGWTSAREGVVIRPAPQSTLAEYIESGDPENRLASPHRGNPPAWIIYDQLVSVGSTPGTSQASGVVKIASAIEYEYVSHLMSRMYKTSLDDLIEAVRAPSKRKRQVRDSSLAPFRMETMGPTGRQRELAPVPESTAAEREAKLVEAKKRMLLRKEIMTSP